MRDRPPHPYAQVPLHRTIMLTLLTLLAIGFAIYYIIRHPLKSIKYTAAVIGLLLLGLLGVFLVMLLL